MSVDAGPLDPGGDPPASPPELPDQSVVEAPSQARQLRFTGDGWGYFRIWIVNVALTLLTLGIYSAWAKVRARRYLYGNVWLGDDAFDYTANPVAILRGRVLLLLVLVPVSLAQRVSILYYYAALLLLMPLVPWVVVRARSFHMRNSRYRSLAFDFSGKYWDAAVWYPLSWAASLVTLGLVRPLTVFGRDRFLVDESSFGNRTFGFTGRPGSYYRMYVITAVVVGVLYVGGVFFLLLVLVSRSLASGADPDTMAPDMGAFMIGSLAVAGVVVLFVAAYLRTRLLCYRWNSSRLGDNEFSLALSFPTMLWLYASNAAGSVMAPGPSPRQHLARRGRGARGSGGRPVLVHQVGSSGRGQSRCRNDAPGSRGAARSERVEPAPTARGSRDVGARAESQKRPAGRLRRDEAGSRCRTRGPPVLLSRRSERVCPAGRHRRLYGRTRGVRRA